MGQKKKGAIAQLVVHRVVTESLQVHTYNLCVRNLCLEQTLFCIPADGISLQSRGGNNSAKPGWGNNE